MDIASATWASIEGVCVVPCVGIIVMSALGAGLLVSRFRCPILTMLVCFLVAVTCDGDDAGSLQRTAKRILLFYHVALIASQERHAAMHQAVQKLQMELPAYHVFRLLWWGFIAIGCFLQMQALPSSGHFFRRDLSLLEFELKLADFRCWGVTFRDFRDEFLSNEDFDAPPTKSVWLRTPSRDDCRPELSLRNFWPELSLWKFRPSVLENTSFYDFIKEWRVDVEGRADEEVDEEEENEGYEGVDVDVERKADEEVDEKEEEQQEQEEAVHSGQSGVVVAEASTNSEDAIIPLSQWRSADDIMVFLRKLDLTEYEGLFSGFDVSHSLKYLQLQYR